jgi:hypothetical protein
MPHGHGEPGCIPNEHCIIHGEDEPDRPDDYRVCGECLHVFRTVEELVEVEITNFGPHSRIIVGGRERPKMYSCPYCTHDW